MLSNKSLGMDWIWSVPQGPPAEGFVPGWCYWDMWYLYKVGLHGGFWVNESVPWKGIVDSARSLSLSHSPSFPGGDVSSFALFTLTP
jgi:hypothetical protein